MREREFDIKSHCASGAGDRACYKASMQRPLRVMLEASCLADGRRDAGIGRYANQMIEALRDVPGIEVTPSIPTWHPHLVHGLGGEPVVGFPTSRQVVTLHDVEMWRGDSAHRLYGALLAPVIRACAGIIAVSGSTRQEAIDALRLDPARIHVVPLGVGPVFSSRPKLRDARTAEAPGLEGIGRAQRPN